MTSHLIVRQRDDEIERLRREGHSYGSIAETVGMSKTGVYNRATLKLGLPKQGSRGSLLSEVSKACELFIGATPQAREEAMRILRADAERRRAS